jgi:anaerobic ribonucleoside-triphosphate reductase activating protein
MANLRLSGIVWESIVDGPGIRCAVFAQGCPHTCPGCHNPQTWSYEGGFTMPHDKIIQRTRKNPLLRGITLTGGEPFEQAEAMAGLARQARSNGYDVVAYTGYTYEELIEKAASVSSILTLLEQVDLLVDGRYDETRRRLDLPFRGSDNQRLVNVPQSLAEGIVRLTDDCAIANIRFQRSRVYEIHFCQK